MSLSSARKGFADVGHLDFIDEYCVAAGQTRPIADPLDTPLMKNDDPIIEGRIFALLQGFGYSDCIMELLKMCVIMSSITRNNIFIKLSVVYFQYSIWLELVYSAADLFNENQLKTEFVCGRPIRRRIRHGLLILRSAIVWFNCKSTFLTRTLFIHPYRYRHTTGSNWI